MNKYLIITLAFFLCLFIATGITYLKGGFTRYDNYGILDFDGHARSIFRNNEPDRIVKSFRWPWTQQVFNHYTIPLDYLNGVSIKGATYYFMPGNYFVNGTIELQGNSRIIGTDNIDNPNNNRD